ncbi:hypothetical protein H9P43_003669 [Blastocladiella emersonii ATCC 22665]|nr:hypothetical protein H9P43_003669 [Blastocladiella emersonii ATCC 22665]
MQPLVIDTVLSNTPYSARRGSLHERFHAIATSPRSPVFDMTPTPSSTADIWGLRFGTASPSTSSLRSSNSSDLDLTSLTSAFDPVDSLVAHLIPSPPPKRATSSPTSKFMTEASREFTQYRHHHALRAQTAANSHPHVEPVSPTSPTLTAISYPQQLPVVVSSQATLANASEIRDARTRLEQSMSQHWWVLASS